MEQKPARSILPKPPRSDLPPLAQTRYKHKRQVVPVACDRCRARKIKCDGERPTCQPCARVDAPCNYQEPRYRAKQAKESSATSNAIGTNHGGLKPPSRVLEWEGEEVLDLLQPSSSRQGSSFGPAPTPYQSSFPQPQFKPRRASQEGASSLPISKWAGVSQDDGFTTHLLNLFWKHDTSITRIIHQDMFVQGLRMENTAPSGTRGIENIDLCSSTLVHSLLALSTLYCLDGDWSEEVAALGRSCAEYSRFHLQAGEVAPSLSVFQSTVALWVYERAIGNLASAEQLLGLVYRQYTDLEDVWATPLIPSFDNEYTWKIHQQISFTAWGFWFLSFKIGLMTGQFRYLPQPRIPMPGAGFDQPDVPFEHQYPSPTSGSHTPGPQVQELFAHIAGLAGESLILVQTSGDLDIMRAKQLYSNLMERRHAASQLLAFQPPASPLLIDACAMIDMTALKLLGPFARIRLLEFTYQQSANDLEVQHSVSLATALWDLRVQTESRLDLSLLCACEIAATTLLPYLHQTATLLEPIRRVFAVLNERRYDILLVGWMFQRMDSLVKNENIWIPEDVQAMLLNEWQGPRSNQEGAAAFWARP